MADEDERYAAMIEFLGCFPTISGPPPSEMSDLGDGVIMFEALSEISPDYFDPATISRDLGDNWALKSSNLRKLLRNLETYYHDVLHKDADFVSMADHISAIARNSETAHIATYVELITAAACTCDNRATYIDWIMNMQDDNKAAMRGVIESSLAKVQDYDDNEGSDEGNDNEGNEDDDNEGESDGSFSDDDFEGGAEMTGLFRNAMQNIDAVTNDLDIGSLASGPGSSLNADTAALITERDELRATIAELKRNYALLKAQSVRFAEDTNISQMKAGALAQDLQERLEVRQNELNDVEDVLKKTKRKMVDAEERAGDMEERNATLADELDVASAKAAQLRKSEATVMAYRKKLEGVGVMNQQMTDLEDTAAGYLKQIMDLEMETKKVPELLKALEKVKRSLSKANEQGEEAEESLKIKSADVLKIKADLSAANTAKRNYEEELLELRTSIQGPDAADIDNLGADMGDFTSAQSTTEVKEKAMRLQIENKALKEQLSALSGEKTLATSNEFAQLKEELKKRDSEIKKLKAKKLWSRGAAAAVLTTIKPAEDMPEDVVLLQDTLKKKELELKKLATDKDRLETYTKRTLAKFQEKYLVALQECKAKLKEKHDKIETLEKRSAAEKSTQKREEKLLSATIYELGLSIMQQNLKER